MLTHRSYWKPELDVKLEFSHYSLRMSQSRSEFGGPKIKVARYCAFPELDQPFQGTPVFVRGSCEFTTKSAYIQGFPSP